MAPPLFVDAQHGLCNRLRVLASAQAIAQASNRELVTIWLRDVHCQATLGELINWDGPVISDPDQAALFERIASRRIVTMDGIAGSEPQAQICPEDTQGALYVRASDALQSPLSSMEAEQQVLRAMRPVQAVQDLVDQVPYPSALAAHIRMGTGPAFDHLPHEAPSNWSPAMHAKLSIHRTASHVDRFIARIDALLAAREAEDMHLFVAADLADTYTVLEARYGARLRYLRRDLFDRSARQLQYALADLILLSAAPRFLASTWSSFSDVAQRLAAPGRPVEQSGHDF